MQDTREQICSLCSANAKFYFVDHDDKKYFDCGNCKRYKICVSAEHYLTETTEEIRKKMAEFASQALADEATLISFSVPTNNLSQNKVVAKHVKRSELLV